MNLGGYLCVKVEKTIRMQGDCSRLSSLVFLGNFLDFGYGSPSEDLELGLMSFGGDLGVKLEKTI